MNDNDFNCIEQLKQWRKVETSSARSATLEDTSRHGKSCKHASNACGQNLRKLWTFLDKKHFIAVFTHQCPQVCIIIQNQSIVQLGLGLS